MRYVLIFSMMVVLCGVSSHRVDAASGDFSRKIDGPDPEVPLPMTQLDAIILDADDLPPLEPNYVQVEYLGIEPPENLQEEIDHLVHGITIDMPPEYDHYGYEMRRYMQTVGNPKIYTDPLYLEAQIKNVRKANIVLKYWRELLNKQATELALKIEKQNVSSSALTSYKQNVTTMKNFMSLAQEWVDDNMKYLELLQKLQGKYELEYPLLKIKDIESMERIYKALAKRQKNALELRMYTPFTVMVY